MTHRPSQPRVDSPRYLTEERLAIRDSPRPEMQTLRAERDPARPYQRTGLDLDHGACLDQLGQDRPDLGDAVDRRCVRSDQAGIRVEAILGGIEIPGTYRFGKRERSLPKWER